MLEKDQRICVCGKISRSSDEDKIVADNIEELQHTRKILKIRCDSNSSRLNSIKAVLVEFKGCTPVYIYQPTGKTLRLDSYYWVSTTPELIAELRKIVSADHLKVE